MNFVALMALIILTTRTNLANLKAEMLGMLANRSNQPNFMYCNLEGAFLNLYKNSKKKITQIPLSIIEINFDTSGFILTAVSINSNTNINIDNTSMKILNPPTIGREFIRSEYLQLLVYPQPQPCPVVHLQQLSDSHFDLLCPEQPQAAVVGHNLPPPLSLVHAVKDSEINNIVPQVIRSFFVQFIL